MPLPCRISRISPSCHFAAPQIDGGYSSKMDHLVCFLPGLLALAHMNGLSPQNSSLDAYTRLGLKHSYLEPASELAYTCQQFYNRTETRLGPEIAFFDAEGMRGDGVAFGVRASPPALYAFPFNWPACSPDGPPPAPFGCDLQSSNAIHHVGSAGVADFCLFL